MNLIKIYRIGHFFHCNGIPFLPSIFRYIIFLLYNSDVSCKAKIGSGTVFGHGGIGAVVHQKSIIGKDCVIGQGVTIGGRSKHPDVPIIGDKVYIAAGARVLGPIKIGSNVVIAANAVVIKDVPDNCIVGGIPAKILKEGILMEDYV